MSVESAAEEAARWERIRESSRDFRAITRMSIAELQACDRLILLRAYRKSLDTLYAEGDDETRGHLGARRRVVTNRVAELERR